MISNTSSLFSRIPFQLPEFSIQEYLDHYGKDSLDREWDVLLNHLNNTLEEIETEKIETCRKYYEPLITEIEQLEEIYHILEKDCDVLPKTLNQLQVR